jgi:hypothetical protein
VLHFVQPPLSTSMMTWMEMSHPSRLISLPRLFQRAAGFRLNAFLTSLSQLKRVTGCLYLVAKNEMTLFSIQITELPVVAMTRPLEAEQE